MLFMGFPNRRGIPISCLQVCDWLLFTVVGSCANIHTLPEGSCWDTINTPICADLTYKLTPLILTALLEVFMLDLVGFLFSISASLSMAALLTRSSTLYIYI